MATDPRHRVVVIGCGFGGLNAAKALRRAPVDVTVIDRTNHHLFQPLLYQLATGILSQGDIAPPIRDVLRHQHNARVVLGEVVGLDTSARLVQVDVGGEPTNIGYDSLIVAAGSRTSYFGHDELAEHAPGMKTVDDALELRGRIFGAFEMAEQERDPAARREWLTFVVVGAGPTGVEMAGQIAELSHRALRRNFRSIDPADARIVLLDAGPRILATFPPSLQRRTQRALERLGVEIHLGSLVTGIDQRGVDTDDPAIARIDARTAIWAAGVEASPLGRLVAEATGAPVDRSGRVLVMPDCSVPGYPELFVVGDLMHLDDLPGVAEVAMQTGRHAARCIVRRLGGDDGTHPFRYVNLGEMATISRFQGVATIGPIRASGFLGWAMWLVVHLAFLTGFKNRALTLASWTIAFVGRGRRERTITEQQVLARRALAAGADRHIPVRPS